MSWRLSLVIYIDINVFYLYFFEMFISENVERIFELFEKVMFKVVINEVVYVVFRRLVCDKGIMNVYEVKKFVKLKEGQYLFEQVYFMVMEFVQFFGIIVVEEEDDFEILKDIFREYGFFLNDVIIVVMCVKYGIMKIVIFDSDFDNVFFLKIVRGQVFFFSLFGNLMVLNGYVWLQILQLVQRSLFILIFFVLGLQMSVGQFVRSMQVLQLVYLFLMIIGSFLILLCFIIGMMYLCFVIIIVGFLICIVFFIVFFVVLRLQGLMVLMYLIFRVFIRVFMFILLNFFFVLFLLVWVWLVVCYSSGFVVEYYYENIQVFVDGIYEWLDFVVEEC